MKLTHQRIEILREISGRADHPDAETIYTSIRTRLPTVSLDTIYRTLWMLSDLGFIATVGPRSTSVRFDPNLKPHHHYMCVRCGAVHDFESEELNEVPVPAVVEGLGSVVSRQVEIRGVCAACAKKDTEGSAYADQES